MYDCFSPYKTDSDQLVRCGNCDNCRYVHTLGWCFRLREQERNSMVSYFVTLTHDDKSLPLTDKGFATLEKTQIQGFMKRLRAFTARVDKKIREGQKPKNIGSDWLEDLGKIKYYAVGEYGHKFKRPHYHLLIFNANADAIINAWGNRGEIHLGDIQGGSTGYCLKYIRKRTWEGYYEGDDRTKIFSTMSKHLGKPYLSKKVVEYHQKNGSEGYHLAYDGRMIPMIRYYRDKIYSKEQLEEILDDLARKRYKDDTRMTELEYLEKCQQMQLLQRDRNNYKKIPPDIWHISSNHRLKTRARRRSTQRVKRSPTKFLASKICSIVMLEDYPLKVGSPYIREMRTRLLTRNLTLQS